MQNKYCMKNEHLMFLKKNQYYQLKWHGPCISIINIIIIIIIMQNLSMLPIIMRKGVFVFRYIVQFNFSFSNYPILNSNS